MNTQDTIDAVARVITTLRNTRAGRVDGIDEGSNATDAIETLIHVGGRLCLLQMVERILETGRVVELAEEGHAWRLRAERLANLLTPLANLAERVAEDHPRQYQEEVAELLDMLNTLPPIPTVVPQSVLARFVVQAGGNRWWMPAGCGYTTELAAAGAFTEAELRRLNIEPGKDTIVRLDEAILSMVTRGLAGVSVVNVLAPAIAGVGEGQ